MLMIDREKCVKDGLCAMNCPRGIIGQTDDGFPMITPEKEIVCQACGHCVAICPHGALDHAVVKLADVEMIDKNLGITKEQAVQFLRSRRSIRVYKPKTVQQEQIQELIEIARYAPTATNAQIVHWTVISGREKLATLVRLTVEWMENICRTEPDSLYAQYFTPVIAAFDAGNDPVLRGAHTLVIASAPKTAPAGLVDCTIALSYLELAATRMALGTCWAGMLQTAMTNSPDVLEASDLPKENTHYYPMMVGYPKFQYHRMPSRRKPDINWI